MAHSKGARELQTQLNKLQKERLPHRHTVVSVDQQLLILHGRLKDVIAEKKKLKQACDAELKQAGLLREQLKELELPAQLPT